MHVGLGVPYAASALFFVCVLAIVFGCWYAAEHTLSIHSIRTPRRELFYWAAVLSNVRPRHGCRGHDRVDDESSATSPPVSCSPSFSPCRPWPAALGLNAVAAFWSAYVLTRPVGASFADWLGVPSSRRGLGLGTGPVTLALVAAIVSSSGS